MTIDYSQLVFLDLETTGLNSRSHEIWDAGYILDDEEKRFFLKPDLGKADPRALEIGKFYDVEWAIRRFESEDPKAFEVLPLGHPSDWYKWSDPDEVAETISRDLRGRHIVGMNPRFDEGFLIELMDKRRQPVTWHYHLVNCEDLMLGYIAAMQGVGREVIESRQENDLDWADLMNFEITFPFKSEALSLAIGVELPSPEERHTSLGDTRWAKRIFEEVMS